jgi:hypothetical protein
LLFGFAIVGFHECFESGQDGIEIGHRELDVDPAERTVLICGASSMSSGLKLS